ncbi:MAG TPA: tetratricopeptide repeat protein [Blastocatellia bacterium]|nr:tetratricopeptide repeat protein [Blastocatellia bacterium]
MNLNNLWKSLKERAVLFSLLISFGLAVSLSMSYVDWDSVMQEEINPTAQVVGTAPPAVPPAAAARDGLTFKKIVTAPVRLFARLFRRGDANVAKANSAKEETLVKVDAAVATAIEREAAATFEQAIELHGKKQLDAAIAKLTAVVGMQPNNSEAYNLLGVCYDEKGQFKDAQDEYQKAIKLEPINARFLNNLGYSYYLANQDKQAIKWYEKALKFTPDDRRIQNNLGLAYGRRGEFAKAKEQFLKAVGEHGALLNLGYIYSQQGRYQQAIEQFEAALKLQPSSLVTMTSLAQVYDRVGRAREAAMLQDQYKKLSNSSQRVQTAEKNQEDDK